MNIDLFPTCLAIAGLSVPKDRIIDGKSLLGLLTTQERASPHELLFFYHQGELEAVRSEKWKYFRSLHHYTWPLPLNKKAGGISEHTKGPLPLLFNLETEPSESYNVRDKYPEVAAHLAEQMATWEKQLAADRKGWAP